MSSTELESPYRNIKNYSIFFLVFILIVVVPPTVALFGFRGIEERINFDKVTFYWSFGAIFVGFIGVGMLNQFASRKSAKYEKAMGWLGSHVHNPEMSLFYHLKEKKFFRWFLVQKNIVFLFLILSPIAGLLSLYTNTFLWHLPNIAEQVLPIGEGILETEPAGVEVFGIFVLITLNMYIWKFFQKKNKWSNDAFWGIVILSSLVIGILYGFSLHFWRYGTEELKLIAVSVFWGVISILTLLFANIFIIWMYKDANNLFLWLKEAKFSNEAVLIVTTIVLVFTAIFYSTVLLRKRVKNRIR